MRPSSASIKVDLPAPFGPTMARRSAHATSRSTGPSVNSPRSTTACSSRATTWPLRPASAISNCRSQLLRGSSGASRSSRSSAFSVWRTLRAPLLRALDGEVAHELVGVLRPLLGLGHPLHGPVALAPFAALQVAPLALATPRRPRPRGAWPPLVPRGRPASRPRTGWRCGGARPARPPRSRSPPGRPGRGSPPPRAPPDGQRSARAARGRRSRGRSSARRAGARRSGRAAPPRATLGPPRRRRGTRWAGRAAGRAGSSSDQTSPMRASRSTPPRAIQRSRVSE